jgi:hypothetical protein
MLCWHADMPTKTTALPSGLLTRKKHGEICKNKNTGKTRIKKSMTLKIINQKVESISCLFNQPGTFFSVCLMSLGFFQPIVKSKSSLWKKCVSADTGGRNANPEKTSNSVKFAFRPSEVFPETHFFPKCIFSEDWKSKLDLFNQPPLTPSFLSVRCHWVFTHSL